MLASLDLPNTRTRRSLSDNFVILIFAVFEHFFKKIVLTHQIFSWRFRLLLSRELTLHFLPLVNFIIYRNLYNSACVDCLLMNHIIVAPLKRFILGFLP